MKKPKKTNVSPNSIKSFYEVAAEGLFETEDKIAMRLIEEHQPLTNRMLMNLMKVERPNVCRILYNFVKAGKLKIAFNDKCPLTGRRVGWYSLIDRSQDNKAA